MSSISSVSSNNAWMQAQMRTRPTAAQQTKLAEDAFSKIDTSGKGSFDIAGLTTAVNDARSASQNKNNSFSSSDIQSAFSKMDSDGDGNVTKQEFTSTMSQLRGRHHHQEDESTQSSDSSSSGNAMDMQSMGGMPPPPPLGGPQGGNQSSGQGSDEGFTADELKAQLDEIGTSDSKRSTLINNVLNNFSTADADGNGKVSFAEAMQLDKSLSSSASASSSTSTSSSSATSASTQLSSATSSSGATAEQIQQRLMRQIMKMMEAYGMDNLSQSASNTASQLSVTA